MPGEQQWELTSLDLMDWISGQGEGERGGEHISPLRDTLEAEQVCGNVLSVWAWRYLTTQPPWDVEWVQMWNQRLGFTVRS